MNNSRWKQKNVNTNIPLKLGVYTPDIIAGIRVLIKRTYNLKGGRKKAVTYRYIHIYYTQVCLQVVVQRWLRLLELGITSGPHECCRDKSLITLRICNLNKGGVSTDAWDSAWLNAMSCWMLFSKWCNPNQSYISLPLARDTPGGTKCFPVEWFFLQMNVIYNESRKRHLLI